MGIVIARAHGCCCAYRLFGACVLTVGECWCVFVVAQRGSWSEERAGYDTKACWAICTIFLFSRSVRFAGGTSLFHSQVSPAQIENSEYPRQLLSLFSPFSLFSPQNDVFSFVFLTFFPQNTYKKKNALPSLNNRVGSTRSSYPPPLKSGSFWSDL